MRLIAANFKAKMSAAKTRADQQTLLASKPDVVTLCEIGGMARALMLRRGFKRAGMRMWASIPDPIAWRSDWELLAKGKHHLSDATNVGPGGAGPTVLRKKDAPWVLLHDPTGDVHFVINAHLAPQPALNEKRGRLHAQQVDALAAKIAQVRLDNPAAIVHVMGDLNTPDRDRLAPVTDQGIDFGAVTDDLHGHQLIYVGSDWKGSRRLLGGLNTDHDALAADVKRGTPTVPVYYPGADRKTQWFGDRYSSDALKAASLVLVLHTTEGTSWPDYAGGSKAPNYTARPDIPKERLWWRQHFEDLESSRALVNLQGGVETNTLNALQVELIGTCDPRYRKAWGSGRAGVDYIFWPEAPAWALQELADFVAYLVKTYALPLEAPVFLPYPESAGNSRVRFTPKEWLNFYGICGHQHVPENTHGDPGNIDIQSVLRMAKGGNDPKPVSNHTTKGRVLVEQGIAELEQANENRKAVHQMAAQIRAALDAGPKA